MGAARTQGPPALVLSLGTHFDPPSLPAAPAGALSQVLRGEENWASGPGSCGLPLLQGGEQGSSTGSPDLEEESSVSRQL